MTGWSGLHCDPILQIREEKHREVRAPALVTQHMRAELWLKRSGFWVYPVTTAREGRGGAEGTVRWTLGEVVLGRHGVIQVRSPGERIHRGKSRREGFG